MIILFLIKHRAVSLLRLHYNIIINKFISYNETLSYYVQNIFENNTMNKEEYYKISAT